jgi:hypothetical protein
MNEKIKQLWDNSIEEFSKQHQYATIMLPEPLREKFAELIVNECAKLVEDNMDPQNAWITPAFIKEHFGVEE